MDLRTAVKLAWTNSSPTTSLIDSKKHSIDSYLETCSIINLLSRNRLRQVKVGLYLSNLHYLLSLLYLLRIYCCKMKKIENHLQ